MRSIDEIKAAIAACDLCDWPECTPKGGRRENQFGCCGTCDAIFKRNKVDFINELIEALINGIPLDRLETICNAERDGRCVVLDYKPISKMHESDGIKDHIIFTLKHEEAEAARKEQNDEQ